MLSKTTRWSNWILTPDKFLPLETAKKLLETARIQAETAKALGRKVSVRDYFIIDLGLSTGLRVMEMAQLKCGDVFTTENNPSLIVRNGKCSKMRLVKLSDAFKRHYNDYIKWKKTIHEPIAPGDALLRSSNTGGHMTTRAIQKAFKRAAARAGLPTHYSIHCLRHTYACQLYKASGYNLRLVQKQLGHSSIRTTEIYADVMEPDIQDALRKLYA